MTIIAIILLILFVLIVWYALAGRTWLKTKPWAASFFSDIEPIEIALFKKSETILIGRLISFGSAFLGLYDTFALAFRSLDLTPITTRIFDFAHIPQDSRAIATTALITALGLIISWLRKRTSVPIELVALPDKTVMENPKVAEAVAMADATKTEAVSVVKQTV